MNKDELIEAYAARIVDSMEIEELVAIAYDKFIDRLESYTDEQLADEIREFAPHLLGE